MNARPLILHTVAASELSPEALLDAPGDDPRGMFSDDHGCVAWWGAARMFRAPDLASLARITVDAWEGAPRDVSLRAFVVAPFAQDPRHVSDPAWSAAHDAVWVLPKLTVTRTPEGTVARWLLEEGETVSLGALSPIPSPASGEGS